MKNPKVENYFQKIDKWQLELSKLREIVLECQLMEELKWGVPCYVYKSSNIIILGGFKDYFVMSFIKGVFLKDSENILVAPGENSNSVRIAKFTNLQEVLAVEQTLKAYIYEAIEVEKLGLKVEKETISSEDFVPELVQKLEVDEEFKTAFLALTPGRQRAYNLHFSAAKQAKTRENRIENYRQRIMDGKGFNDCVCGLSKRMPNCDGSHKYINSK